jgi:hypothetical protein
MINDEDWRPLQTGEADVPGYFWIPLSEDEGGEWSSCWMRIQPGARGPMRRRTNRQKGQTKDTRRSSPLPALRQSHQARVGAIALRGRSVAMIRYMPPPITTPKNHP